MQARNMLRVCLQQIEAELKRHQMWQAEMPSPQALSSQQPFAIDTLRFEQWLQFILIPNIHALLDAAAILPTAFAVAPMAEQSFANRGELKLLIQLLQHLDQLVAEEAAQSHD